MRHAVLLAVVVTAFAANGCASAEKKPAPKAAAPATTSMEAMEADVMRETRKTAAAELQCPEDQLLVQCTGRDALGGCVSIQAKGCDKTLDYSFGAE
ncbi:MAG TPA: hypothetical protein VGF99_16465 [Myxococcota bacterium]